MRPLSDIKQCKVKYIVKAYLVALVSSVIVAVTVYFLINPNVPEDTSGTSLAIEFVGMVLFSPAIETLLMIPIFAVIGKSPGV